MSPTCPALPSHGSCRHDGVRCTISHAGKLSLSVQALERLEEFLGVGHVEADSVTLQIDPNRLVRLMGHGTKKMIYEVRLSSERDSKCFTNDKYASSLTTLNIGH